MTLELVIQYSMWYIQFKQPYHDQTVCKLRRFKNIIKCKFCFAVLKDYRTLIIILKSRCFQI